MLRRVIARLSTLDGTVPESAPTFAERVGGRWVISWQAYTLGATVNTVLLGLTGGSVGAESVSLGEFPRWCALGALASAVVGVYAFAANATVFRRKRQTPAALPVSVAFHASVGLVFAGSSTIFGRNATSADRKPVERIAAYLGTKAVKTSTGSEQTPPVAERRRGDAAQTLREVVDEPLPLQLGEAETLPGDLEDGGLIARINPATQHSERHGAVHRTGVEIADAEPLSDRATDRGFSGARGTIDRDDRTAHQLVP